MNLVIERGGEVVDLAVGVPREDGDAVRCCVVGPGGIGGAATHFQRQNPHDPADRTVVRQQVGVVPGPVDDCPAVTVGVEDVRLHRLRKPVDALALPPRLPRPVERGQQHPRQNGDDRNYDEKFNQSKISASFHGLDSLSLEIVFRLPIFFVVIIPEKMVKSTVFDTIIIIFLKKNA